MEKTIFIFLMILHFCCGVIYKLNDTMYYKMPRVFHLDDYAPCMSDPDGVYCTAKFALVSDTESDLLNMIHNFSEHRVKHYNHSSLRYGVCITRSCQEYYYDVKTKEDLRTVLERCLNDTMWKKYELKTKILDYMVCNTVGDKVEIRHGDYVVAAIFFALLMINIIGTAYDIIYTKSRAEKVSNQFLLTFSIKRNLAKLVSPFSEFGTRLARIRGFNGGRTLSTCLVIIAHSILPFINNPNDTRDIEAIYDLVPYHTFINGTPIVQVFFMLSGFLLTYNFKLKSEKKKITWHLIPIGILLRWLRLTPAYALVLALTATWLRFAGSGPLWHLAVVVESEDCRRDAWKNLLYINNFFDNTQCMAQSWYLASDMQLYCLGLVICALIKTNHTRKLVLSLLFAAGVIIPTVITYAMDLDAVLIVAPETALQFFVSDATFNNVYKTSYTNLAGYVMGLSMGFVAYHLQTENFKIEKYKNYLWIYQLLLPTALMITWMGSIFYRDAPPDSIYVRALYAGIVKPVFTFIIVLFALGLMFRCDKFYRRLFEWRCWATTGRLSYCAYILHVLVIRTIFGTMSTQNTMTFFHLLHGSAATVVFTFLLAVPCWLLVEAPMTDLIKITFPTLTGAKAPSKADFDKPEDSEVVNL